MAIYVSDILSNWLLKEYPEAGVSKKRIIEEILYIYQYKKYNGTIINTITKEKPSASQINKLINELITRGVLISEESINNLQSISVSDEDKNNYDIAENFLSMRYKEDFPSNFIISGRAFNGIEKLVCDIFPYGFVSYLNAMKVYNITDKLPKIVYFTTCSRQQWKELSISDIRQRKNHLKNISDCIPVFPSNRDFFSSRILTDQKSKKIPIKRTPDGINVPEIGELFLDMLREPEKCGGEQHVIDVIKEYGKTYSRLIIRHTEKFGTIIDKVRVGFIVEKILNLKNPIVYNWKDLYSKGRGSSRKFFANRSFESWYNDEWNISLNFEGLRKYGICNKQVG